MNKGVILFFLGAILIQHKSFSQIVFGQQGRNNNDNQTINYSSPREYEIEAIEVKGVQFLDNNALVSMSGLRVGDKIKIPGDEISQAIKKLWKQGIIGNVTIYASKIEGDKISLVIELTERPRLSRFDFKGVNKSLATELEEKIGVIKGRVLTDAALKNTELAIRKHLDSKGFLNAEIDLVQQRDSVLRNNVSVIVNIDRKNKVKVKNITFTGNQHFSQKKLRKKLRKTGERPRIGLPKELLGRGLHFASHPKELLHFITHKDSISTTQFSDYWSQHMKLNFFKSSKFVKTEFEEDKEGLINFYKSKGYRDAEIISDSTYAYDASNMNIDLHVNSGNKYYFRNITWEGNFLYPNETLDGILGIKKGDVYDLELINTKLTFNPTGSVDISSLYMDDGYLFFNVTPVETKIVGDSIDMEMRLYEGAQATINKVYITGNDKTNDHVIMREIRTLPGDKFSRALLLRTQNDLRQLGYFDPEQITPIPIPDQVNESVDIEWALVEQPNDQIQLSGGWGGTFGFVGTVGLTFNNFSLRNIPHRDKWRGLPVGDGQKLSLQLQANGRRFQSYSLSFTEPWIGGRKPNAFSISLSRSIQRSINSYTNEEFGSLKVSGITLSLGRRVRWPDDFFVVSNSIAYLRYDLDNFGRSLGFETGAANSFTFNNTISRRSTDNPMYPRTGSEISLSASFTPPYSLFNDIDYETADNATKYKWLEYHKWNFDSWFYLKLAGDLVLASRAHLGLLGSYKKKTGIGPFERFQLGGDGLTGQSFLLGTDVIGLRGYENNSLAPVDDQGTLDDSSDDIAGGTIFNKFVLELRYPVSLAQSATIYGLAFYESGNNWNDLKDFNPYNQFRSAGLGIRIFMPAFGLMGLDWAYGFDENPIPGTTGISGAQFHFSIGQQIR
ncbi:MAG: BamA/TamA family outer membrane protein [Cytophagales bacterium]|nr:BamA/TamA family outer membrane protein [Cytophagales bacterium]